MTTSQPSHFEMVKAALATALEYEGKTLQDMERDILKQAKEEDDKGKDKPKGRLGMLAMPLLAAHTTQGTLNFMGNGAIALGAGAANLDRSMSDSDKPIEAMAQRTKMLHRAVEDLQARHPNLA